ncbi:MIZ/SP-RING zinc finger domain-containing protein [Spironucleus salmonicida]|uniref:MIZ/SP-RING zinc finger domain-containing protein n=1 Tax=Spironucleus salmonicida TaxID=348837 RepID=V6LUR3_9EUKA|nr:MIZ/SP-RING zinc finger domain-containing protein [Spironucleus salmonicida]|eukprot:EST47446.1 MIZ/SP-RING zinc finger domain-containing protein [Spironucleus salmonicida]
MSKGKEKQAEIVLQVLSQVGFKFSTYKEIDRKIFSKLKIDQLKQAAILISWVFNIEMPEKLLKKNLQEFMEQNLDLLLSQTPVWTKPKKIINAQIFETYVQLGAQFGAEHLQIVKGVQDFYIPRQALPLQAIQQLSPLYQHFQVISLFQQDLEKEYKFQFEIPTDSINYLNEYQQCRLLMYCFYETLGDNHIPSIDVVPTQKIFNNNHHQQLLFANGLPIIQERIQKNDITDTMVFPLPFDITQAAKLKANKVFIDVQNISLPNHPDANKDKSQYKFPYFVFYLAKKLNSQEIFQKLLKKPLLTCQLFKDALTAKKALLDYNIILISNTAEDEELEQVSETISLVSHLSMKPIQFPVRSSQCRHFNKIMDLEEFISRVESGLSFRCSICNEQCSFDQLHIDAFAWYLIQNKQVGSVEVKQDGQFDLKETKQDDEDSGWF